MISRKQYKHIMKLARLKRKNKFPVEKICSKCHIKKPINQFCHSKNRYDSVGVYCKECVKKDYLLNRKKIMKKHKEYYNSLGGLFASIKGSAKQRKIFFNLTKKEFVKWYRIQSKVCVYCKRNVKQVIHEHKGFFKRLTIDRIDNKLGYQLDNIVLCCFKCNTIKGNDLDYKTMKKIGKILQNNYNKG